jgi:uncharacterized protein (TIGR00297 family)
VTTYIALYAVPSARNLLAFAAISVLFAAFGKIVRGVTTDGAVAGAVVCFVLLAAAGIAGFSALLTVFVLTWACTKFGYARKQRLGIAEQRSGRDARQVLANLGVAAACAIAFVLSRGPGWLVAMGAALAEAAGDTVSSEIGQAAGEESRLITTWNRVPVGTNGAVTLAGSAAGAFAAIIVVLVSYLTGLFGLQGIFVCVLGAIVGTMADSVLGATIERRGLLGNNGVNFISTLVAGVMAWFSSAVFSH